VDKGVGFLGGLIGAEEVDVEREVDLDRQAGRQVVGLPLRAVGGGSPLASSSICGSRDNRGEELL
jgi:hypothetical protein